MRLVDTHAHLYMGTYRNDRDTVIERSINSGVDKIILPNLKSDTIPEIRDITQKYPDHCFAAIGLHPGSVDETYDEELKVIEDWLQTEQFFAIGETGMDLYRDDTYKDEQLASLHHHLQLAYKYNLPLILHQRNAFNEIMESITNANLPGLRGVFHSFSEDLETAQKIIDLGFKIGIGGIVTFKNASLDVVAKEIPLEHIILETDAPFLTPSPYRGKRNESSYTIYVAKKLAEIKNVSVDEIADVTTQNAHQLFSLV